jgi:hypothetical protein
MIGVVGAGGRQWSGAGGRERRRSAHDVGALSPEQGRARVADKWALGNSTGQRGSNPFELIRN